MNFELTVEILKEWLSEHYPSHICFYEKPGIRDITTVHYDQYDVSIDGVGIYFNVTNDRITLLYRQKEDCHFLISAYEPIYCAELADPNSLEVLKTKIDLYIEQQKRNDEST